MDILTTLGAAKAVVDTLPTAALGVQATITAWRTITNPQPSTHPYPEAAPAAIERHDIAVALAAGVVLGALVLIAAGKGSRS